MATKCALVANTGDNHITLEVMRAPGVQYRTYMHNPSYPITSDAVEACLEHADFLLLELSEFSLQGATQEREAAFLQRAAAVDKSLPCGIIVSALDQLGVPALSDHQVRRAIRFIGFNTHGGATMPLPELVRRFPFLTEENVSPRALGAGQVIADRIEAITQQYVHARAGTATNPRPPLLTRAIGPVPPPYAAN